MLPRVQVWADEIPQICSQDNQKHTAEKLKKPFHEVTLHELIEHYLVATRSPVRSDPFHDMDLVVRFGQSPIPFWL